MKKLFYIALCMCFAPMMAFAQVYVVAPNGDTGVGTNAPAQKLDVSGSMRVGPSAGTSSIFLGSDDGFELRRTGTGSSRFYHFGVAQYQFRAENASDITFLTDAGTLRMAIKHTTGNLQLFGTAAAVKPGGGMWTAPSDRRLKSDIANYDKGLEELVQVNPVYYKYTEALGKNVTNKQHVGVVAQELQKVAPSMVNDFELTDDEGMKKGDYLSVDPTEFVYMLINSVKEQQAQIEALKGQVETLTSQITGTNASTQTIELGAEAGLMQNQPNPFSEQTTIKFTLPKNSQSANMQITDMSGKVLKVAQLDRNAVNGELVIKANELQAGTYLYTLIVNGQIMGTKKMILTK